ncbi:MAG TPA: tetratricopeptide repeat protein [Verrucomicrobiae bacterium]|nr:tetratricopeptide repeat protein [Verrucomicrobiae bacterium]
MNDLLIGLLSSLLATNPPAAASNLLHQKTGLRVALTNPNDPLERELKQIMAADDAAQAEVDDWILTRQKEGSPEHEVLEATFRARILERFKPVRKSYEQFLEAHPDHAAARLAYGSFLSDLGDDTAAENQWERARETDPTNAAAWNNLANHYGHFGPVAKAFEYYARAIELEPRESLYYQNMATTVFLFRTEATNYYGITEQQVFEKAMNLYKKALELDPQNFRLAAEVAQTYFGIKPLHTDNAQTNRQAELKLADQAMAAWRVALKLADNDLERESVHLNLARWQINTERFADAHRSLNLVSNQALLPSKNTLTRKLTTREASKATNSPASPTPASPTPASTSSDTERRRETRPER